MASDADDLTPLVEGIHNIVVAPERLEALLDIWSSATQEVHHFYCNQAELAHPLSRPETSKSLNRRRAAAGSPKGSAARREKKIIPARHLMVQG